MSRERYQRGRLVAGGGKTSAIELPLTFYNCDRCNAEIRPGDRCCCWTVWTEERQEPGIWETDYLDLHFLEGK